MSKSLVALLFAILVPTSSLAGTCSVLAVQEPPPMPGQAYLYVRFTGLVQLLVDPSNMNRAWVLVPNAKTPGDYKLGYGADIMKTPHRAALFVAHGMPLSGLSSLDRCDNYRDSRTPLPGRSLSDRQIVQVGSPGILTVHDLSLVADIDHLVEEVRDWDGASELEKTPAPLASTTSQDLLARVVLDRGDLFVDYQWTCDSSEDFDYVRWGQIAGSSVNNQLTSIKEVPLAAGFSVRVPISGNVTFEFSDLQGTQSSRIEIAPVNDRIEILIENSPIPSAYCHDPGLHFAAHYFLSGTFGETDHVLVPVPSGSSGGAADDAMCSPGSSDGRP